ncbi:hypothetical protein Golob_016528 [Gossypium lobatum]|uniref:Uncharacterized protein n=1 Tax=Gossypium lobatum TaxID=34289 RepID=A0A7J8M4M9_9ROSI|nr:hypothetical protein [Gossypium lobatum]
MATSAFKSTSKRSSLGDSADVSSSNRASVHRRARSLSRFSRRLVDDDEDETTPAPKTRGRTVNTARGLGLPEINLDDLAIELFDSSLSGQSASWNANVSTRNGEGGVVENVVQRRGRSVSRRGTSGSSVNSGSGGRLTSDTANSRRRRSVSVARYQISDSESDLDHPQNTSNRASMRSSIGENYQISSTYKPTASNNRQGLRRSLSQKDLKYHDDYSNHTSALTDDDTGDALSNKSGMERIIRAVYAQKKGEAHPTGDDVNGGLYAAMRKELRHAVEEIKTQLEQAMVKTKKSNIASDGSLHLDNSDFLQALSTIRRKCVTKLEKTEKRRQDLSAEILLEKHGRELSKIVKELLSEPKNSIVEKSFRTRKKSHDQNTTSKQLTEEAERYIEDFISNVEDTDISSLDGDRSDTNSSIRGIAKTPNFQSPAVFKSVPVEMDGVMLPWLQWETSNDATPSLFENQPDLSQEAPSIQDLSNQFRSSNGSWSPAFSDCPSVSIGEDRGTKFGEQGKYHNHTRSSSIGAKTTQFDVNDYLNTKGNEAFLHEIWCQRRRISSGGLLLCNHIMF